MTTPANAAPQDYVAQHPGTPEYNLLEEQWIPVEYVSGGTGHASVRDIYANSQNVADLDASDFLEYVALLRLLTSLTYSMVGEDWEEYDWEAIAEGTQDFPIEPVEKVLKRISNHFWLYHPKTPFLQQNEVRKYLTVTNKNKNPTLKDFTHSIYTCLPSSPEARTQTWFTGSRGEYPETVDRGVAAKFLVTRHFCSLAGNEQDYKLPTMAKPSRRSSGTVALPNYAQATYIIRKKDTLAGTLLVNLHRKILEEVTESSVFFWEDPLNPAAHMDDLLYLYTATAAGAYIPYQGNTISRVVRTSIPLPNKEAPAELVGFARVNDPHVIRFSKENTPARKTGDVVTAYFDPSAHSYQQIWETYNKLHSTGKKSLNFTERDHLLQPKNVGPVFGKPVSTEIVAISMNTNVGSSMGPKIQEAIGGTITPTLFLASPAKRKNLLMLLNNIAGASNSLIIYVGRAVKFAFGAHTVYRNAIMPVLWGNIIPHIDAPKERIMQTPEGETPQVSLTDEEKNEWVEAGMKTYNTLTQPLLNNPRTVAQVLKQKNILRRNLRSVMFDA